MRVASNILELVNGVEHSENCRDLINAWNFFSDLASSLNVGFMGDSDEGLTVDIYDMLFSGVNLKILKNDEYHPVFDDEESRLCVSILQDGLSVLEMQLAEKPL